MNWIRRIYQNQIGTNWPSSLYCWWKSQYTINWYWRNFSTTCQKVSQLWYMFTTQTSMFLNTLIVCMPKENYNMAKFLLVVNIPCIFLSKLSISLLNIPRVYYRLVMHIHSYALCSYLIWKGNYETIILFVLIVIGTLILLTTLITSI